MNPEHQSQNKINWTPSRRTGLIESRGFCPKPTLEEIRVMRGMRYDYMHNTSAISLVLEQTVVSITSEGGENSPEYRVLMKSRQERNHDRTMYIRYGEESKEYQEFSAKREEFWYKNIRDTYGEGSREYQICGERWQIERQKDEVYKRSKSGQDQKTNP